jgi:hypothetical protein
MPILQGLKAVTFFVDDPKAVGEWYHALLDSAPIRSSENLVLLRAESFELAFHRRDFSEVENQSSVVPYFSVGNLDLAITLLLQMGARIRRQPMRTEEGSRIAQVIDPFGNTIGLLESP